MKIRKIIKTIISLTTLGITGCIIAVSCGISYISEKLNLKEPKEYDPREWRSNDQPYAEEIMLNVLKCFDEKDKKTLKNMFSAQKVSSCLDLDKRIDEAMNYYEGQSVSHDEPRCSACSSHFNRDHYEYKSVLIKTENIVTDTGKTYPKIELIYVLVSDEDPSKIGLVSIYFSDENGNVILRV